MKAITIPSSILISTMVGAILTACTTAPTKKTVTITPPTVVKAPNFTDLPADSCKGSETIHTPAKLSLNRRGDVTQVSGLKIKDTQLSHAITREFKRAKYTPYKVNGQPVARHLDVAIGLKCPTTKKSRFS